MTQSDIEKIIGDIDKYIANSDRKTFPAAEKELSLMVMELTRDGKGSFPKSGIVKLTPHGDLFPVLTTKDRIPSLTHHNLDCIEWDENITLVVTNKNGVILE